MEGGGGEAGEEGWGKRDIEGWGTKGGRWGGEGEDATRVFCQAEPFFQAHPFQASETIVSIYQSLYQMKIILI